MFGRPYLLYFEHMAWYMEFYKCNHQTVAELFSDDDATLEKTIETLTDTNSAPEDVENLRTLLSKNYHRDPRTKVGTNDELLSTMAAMRTILKKKSLKNLTIEFYPDEDNFPEFGMYFPFNEWDTADDFDLPISPYGTPSLIYRDKTSLADFLPAFEYKFSTGEYNQEFTRPDELKRVIDFITEALKEDVGVFIHCNQ